MNIVICGGGNGAHALAVALAEQARQQKHSVSLSLYTPLHDEAHQIRSHSQKAGVEGVFTDRRVRVRIDHISSQPDIVSEADVVVLVLPAFAHGIVLKQVIPRLPEGAWMGAMPARGGFEFQAGKMLKTAGRDDVLVFGFQTLPWACRLEEPGRRVQVLGRKQAVSVASNPPGASTRVAAFWARHLAMPVIPIASMLGLTLGNMGQLIHPAIMVSLLKDRSDWHWLTREEVPLFYQGVTPQIAGLLAAMSGEILHVARRLQACLPHVLLGSVPSIERWIRTAYRNDIADSSTLASCFRTNRAYVGLRLPVNPHPDGGWKPALNTRYFTEDVPFGLMVSQAIADMIGVKTPAIDEVIGRAERLCRGEQRGGGGRADLGLPRTPQNWGVLDLAQLAQCIGAGSRRTSVGVPLRRTAAAG